jgi:hypothetical protein
MISNTYRRIKPPPTITRLAMNLALIRDTPGSDRSPVPPNCHLRLVDSEPSRNPEHQASEPTDEPPGDAGDGGTILCW